MPREREVVDSVIVPLDGSSAAEVALPNAISLAEALSAELRLVRVTISTAGHASGELLAAAQAYVQFQQDAIERHSTCQVVSVVREGIPVEVIADEAARTAWCIVLTAHGWGTGQRQVLGSIAEQLLRVSPVPALLIPTTAMAQGRPEWRRLLLAVDSPSDVSLIAAPILQLARALHMSVTVLHVQPMAHEHPVHESHGQPADGIGAAINLGEPLAAGLATRAHAAAITAEPRVTYGEPSARIVAVASQLGVAAIALSTHARSSFERARFGSVAMAVIERSPVPVLVFGPQVLRTLARKPGGSAADRGVADELGHRLRNLGRPLAMAADH